MTPCAHTTSEFRIRTLSNQATAIHKQCLSCGTSLAGAISKSKFTPEQIAAMPAYDNDLQEQANYEKNMAHNEAREIERLEKQKINRAKYREYLCSPAWQMKREAVLERDQYLCQGCRCNKATDVHHKTYSHIYDELLFQLVAVCRPCHDRLHNDETP